MFLQIDAEHRTSKGVQRQRASLGVQVDDVTVAPGFGDRFGGLGHVPAEFCDRLLGEHRLQRAAPGHPRCVRKVGEVRPQDRAHLVEHRGRLVGGGVLDAQHVSDATRRRHQHHRRHEPTRTEREARHRSTRVAQPLWSRVKCAYGLYPLPIGQGIPWRQWQRRQLARRLVEHPRTSLPVPQILTSPVETYPIRRTDSIRGLYHRAAWPPRPAKVKL